MSSCPKVLLIEDDHLIAEALIQALHAHYQLDGVASGKLALYKSDREAYDLIILDMYLPAAT